MFENIGPGHGVESSKRRMYAIARGAAVEAGEQQLKRTQSGSSSWKRRQTGSSSGCRNRAREQLAAEADAIGEKRLCTESCPAPDYAR